MDCLLVEKYRPKTLDEYIGNEHIKEKVKIYLQDNQIPNLLFYGSPGVGKSSISKIIINTLNCDYIYINASDENGIETVRTKIKSFASTVGFSDIKIIVLDEFDRFSVQAQSALNNTIEAYSQHTRFIMTCNYIERVIPAILSRLQKFDVQPPSKGAVAKHVMGILDAEHVTYDKKDVAEIIKLQYPDIREIIQSCELQTINDVLTLDSQALLATNSLNKIFNELANYTVKSNVILANIRQIITDNRIKTFDQMFRYIYDKLDTIDVDDMVKATMIVIIAEYQYKDAFIPDHEINAMAMFIELINALKS
jgi:DNA polymerase III delta prime subunit